MAKKGTIIMLAALAAFLLAASGYFIGRSSVHSVRISTERTPPEFSFLQLTGSKPTQNNNAELLDINAATVQELAQLPQIGETIAQRIVDFRDANGRFSATSELMNVEGIGQTRFDLIKDYITVR